MRLRISWYWLQSPGLGCDGAVFLHLNYSSMVRPEITRVWIWSCGLELSSLEHDPGAVSCKRGNAPIGCTLRTEFLDWMKDHYTSVTLLNSVNDFVCLLLCIILFLLKWSISVPPDKRIISVSHEITIAYSTAISNLSFTKSHPTFDVI
jgi:hypothetical protein